MRYLALLKHCDRVILLYIEGDGGVFLAGTFYARLIGHVRGILDHTKGDKRIVIE